HGANLTDTCEGSYGAVLLTPRWSRLVPIGRRHGTSGGPLLPRTSRLAHLAARRAIWAQWTDLTGGPPGRADASAVEDQSVVEEHPLLGRERLLQVKLDLVRVRVARERQAPGDPTHVRVHRDRLAPERVGQHHVGRLAAHAREGRQLLHGIRD